MPSLISQETLNRLAVLTARMRGSGRGNLTASRPSRHNPSRPSSTPESRFHSARLALIKRVAIAPLLAKSPPMTMSTTTIPAARARDSFSPWPRLSVPLPPT